MKGSKTTVETRVQCGWLNRMLSSSWCMISSSVCALLYLWLEISHHHHHRAVQGKRDNNRNGGNRTTHRTTGQPARQCSPLASQVSSTQRRERDRNHGEMIYAPIINEWFILLRISTHGDRDWTLDGLWLNKRTHYKAVPDDMHKLEWSV